MTAVTEILEHCKKLISEGSQIDTQGLVHWIEDKLLEMEKEQIIMFGAQCMVESEKESGLGTIRIYELYYNETF